MADVRLTVLPASAQVAPGGRLSLSLAVHNDSRIVDRYHLTVAGVAEDWIDLEKTDVSLFPGASERVQLTVHPPAGTGTTAGDYALTVQATSENDHAVQVSATVALTVAAIGGLGLDVLPADTEGRQAVFRVTLLNGTNADVHLLLAARDSEEGLLFVAEPSNPLTVPAGGQVDVTVRASPRSQPLFGRPHPYEIEFRAPHADDSAADPFLAEVDPSLIRQARFTYLPRSAGLAVPPWLRRLPRWLFILLLLLLILLLVVVQRRSGSQ